MSPRVFSSLAAAVVLAATIGVAAATPTFWRVSTQVALLRGEVEALSIDSDGRLVLGPAVEPVHESTAPFLWALVAAPDDGLWAGSGNEGKVFHVARDGRVSTFFDSAELAVHALAPAPEGGLYVGTSPDGRIYRVAADGRSEVFFDPEERYIWALAVDPQGDVFAATGDKGVIYRIAPDGTGAPFYRTRASNVVSLAFDREGRLLAGTEAPGQIFRIDRDGRAFVLLDSSFREIHALRLDAEGIIYAAAVSSRPGAEDRPAEAPAPDPGRPQAVGTVSTEITGVAVIESAPAGGPPPPTTTRPDRRALKGAVYRIMPDGLWDTVWESAQDLPYDLSFDADGGLLIGTGNDGKIYRVAGDPAQTTLLVRAAAQQVTRFLPDGSGRQYYATANPGKIFRLGAGRVARGTYESEVRDAATVASWGTIQWRMVPAAGARVELFTRSGNTAVPDETWSEWSGPYTNPDGEQIASPKARYLQWRAVLTGGRESPVLTSVTAAYLQRNLRPRVASITVHPPGIVFQKPFSSGDLEIAGYEDTTSDGRSTLSTAVSAQPAQPAPPLGRRIYQKGLQTFVWKAEDDNDDRLQYDVLYRREGDATWKTLRRGLWDPILTWDTTSVPDGTYVIKVVASDAPSNSPGTALSGELESTSFDIDNTPPRIEIGTARRDGDRVTLPFVVRDDHSPVLRVEYSLDANRWQVIYPQDGIPDSRVEEFELVLDGEREAGSVIIRASDAMNNSSTAVGDLRAGRQGTR